MTTSFVDRRGTVAGPGWNRWLVPPAALAIHLSIGQAYAWSVLKSPIQQALHTSSVSSALPFQLAIVMLGLAAAFGGTTVERRGPRWSMLVAAALFAGGFGIAALGAATSHLWLIVLGYGGVGGIGIGIGYIAPVSTLIKWFPDRPGLATGLAIMGFGGGALIASPWSTAMLAGFGSTPGGIAATLAVHGGAYFVFMIVGAVLVRVPADGWRPPHRGGLHAKVAAPASEAARSGVPASVAMRTPQFWLLWVVLCFSVTAGIGVLERAAPLYQDYFPGAGAAAAAAFVSVLSLANMAGRFVWSSASDLIGRKNAYRAYLGLGAGAYLVLLLAGPGDTAVFLVATLLVLSFYGAGFATIPAYLKDLFGNYEVGAIHGRLLTAWSAAGVLGPLIVDGIIDAQGAAPGPGRYTVAFTIMIVLLVIGFVANELIRPVAARHVVEPAPAPTTVATPAAVATVAIPVGSLR